MLALASTAEHKVQSVSFDLMSLDEKSPLLLIDVKLFHWISENLGGANMAN